jgi:hypothetical protein
MMGFPTCSEDLCDIMVGGKGLQRKRGEKSERKLNGPMEFVERHGI